MSIIREVVPYKEYYWDFYFSQPKKVQEKIDYVLQIIMSVQHVSDKFLKHLDDGIYEVRIKTGSNIYRIFCFFDEGKLVVLLHAIQKKTQKTPKKEINKAKRLRTQYHEDKATP